MTITEFLLARIAEDERRAEGSGTIAWLSFRDTDGRMLYTAVAASDGDRGWLIDGEPVEDYADCTVIYAESHRLAECAAKRAIINLSDDVQSLDWAAAHESGGCTEGTAEEILRVLAAVYAGHPDYQQEWAA